MAPAALPAAFPCSRRVLPPSLSSAGLLPAVRSCQIQPSCAGRGLGSIPAGAGPGCELMMREPEVAGERLGWRRARRSSRKELSLPLGFAAALAALGETGKKQRGSHRHTPGSVLETRGSCRTIPAPDGSAQQSAWQEPGDGMCHPSARRAPHTRSPLLPVCHELRASHPAH